MANRKCNDKKKNTQRAYQRPAHQYIHILVFSLLDSFLQRALSDKDLVHYISLDTEAAEAYLVT